MYPLPIARHIAKVSLLSALVLSTTVSAQHDFFAIGASTLSHCDFYLDFFMEHAGLDGDARRFEIPGAGMNWIWSHREQYTPNPEDILRTDPFDYLLLGAGAEGGSLGIRTDTSYTGELPASIAMIEAAMEANPNVKPFIMERYDVEPDEEGNIRFCYFEETCNHEETIDYWFHPNLLNFAREVAKAIERPVYVVAIGTILEEVKQLITSGALDNYSERIDVHNSFEDSHLSELGRYVQGAATWASVYQRDPRDLPNVITQWGDTLLVLSQHDADLINETIYNTVRNLPISGWCEGEPTDYDGYMDALNNELPFYETFDNLPVSSSKTFSSGSFVGTNGLEWEYERAFGAVDGSQGITLTGYTCLLDRSRQGVPASLSVTLPTETENIFFQYRSMYFGHYELVVVADDDTLARLDKLSYTDQGRGVYAYALTDLDLAPGTRLKFLSMSPDEAIRLDNVRWDAEYYEIENPTANQAPALQPHAARQSLRVQDGLLTLARPGSGVLTIHAANGRTVADIRLNRAQSVPLSCRAGVYFYTLSEPDRSVSGHFTVAR